MRRTLSLLLGTGILAAGLAACGGSSASSASSTGGGAAAAATTSSAAPTAGAATSRLSISAPRSGALMFSTRTLTAKAGTVAITFTNDSTEGHNLTVSEGAKGTVIGATPTFVGGSRTLTLHVRAGRYTYYCSVPGHRQAGMQGTLTVS